MISPPWYNIVGQSAKWVPVRILGFNLDPNYGREIERDYTETTLTRELKVTADARGAWDAVWQPRRRRP